LYSYNFCFDILIRIFIFYRYFYIQKGVFFMSAERDKIGSVLVVGGGISGIQSSLDLAEMGYYVYLVEKNPAIGGRMAQLDKVFPTNDCSMCIISPKLNDIGANINIMPIMNGELISLEGEAGNFTAKILKKPRYLDSLKCTACGDCAKVCPVDILNEFNENQNTRKVVNKSYAQAFPNSYSLTKESISPCVVSCPAHVNAHGYIALASYGRFQEALETILDVLPLPGTLGRICAHPCESYCRRGLLEEPLAIKEIKRLVADKGDLTMASQTIPLEEEHPSKCAIVGAGPAGLTAAYHLARRGIKSVIFEKSSVPGGALRLGIPDYRLPPMVLNSEIDFILNLTGAKIEYNKALGKDFTIDSLFEEGYKAVFLAMGAHKNAPLGVAGEELSKVISGVEFLRKINLGERINLSKDLTKNISDNISNNFSEKLSDNLSIDLSGKKVLVIGAGNVAMDSARVAIRLGAVVFLAYRRGRGAMPAWPWEVEEAASEGVKLLLMRSPIAFKEALDKIIVSLVKTKADGDINDRKAKLTFILTDVLDLTFDLVISATGHCHL
jgi:NADPH-dependent glutamate synthase beta subunit-like oxidoreductase/NAD-dependent dihydropyrimidine dehydrogenase PreA subunit